MWASGRAHALHTKGINDKWRKMQIKLVKSLITMEIKGWGAGSAVKSTCRGPEFGSQHSHWAACNHLSVVE